MLISQDRHAGNVIKSYQPGEITINEQQFSHNIGLTIDKILSDMSLDALPILEDAHCQHIIDLGIDIILFGTGDKQLPLPAKQQAYFAKHGIGCETMTSTAACHTYTVLASEERRVCALIKV